MKEKIRESLLDLRRLAQEPFLLLVVILIMAGLILFVLFPLFQVFKACFFVPTEDGSIRFTLKYFTELLSKPYNRQPFYNSIILGVCVSIIGTIIGFIFAFSITRVDIPFKKFFRAVATFPIISPPFVIALSAILLLGRNGIVTKGILLNYLGVDIYNLGFNIYGLFGLVLVETLAYFPTAFLLLVGVLQSIDPSLEESALDLGASKSKVFTSITLPLAMPGILSSMFLLFVESLADFGNPLILSGRFNVLSVQAYLQITGNDNQPGGAALAIILLIPSLIGYFLQNYFLEKKSFVTVTGKAFRGGIKREEKHIKYPLVFTCFSLVGFIFLFYGLVIIGSFTKLWGADYSFTFKNYIDTFIIGWDYIKDSLLLAAIATPITGLLGMIIAYLVVRKRFIGRKLMEVVSMLTFAVPGTVVGIGYILAFNQKPLLLQGTAAIIVLLFVFRNAPVGIRSGIATLKQISTSIEEASEDLGASSLTTFRRVTLPLIVPAFFSGLVYSFVRCMTAISAVIFVVSGDWNLITVAILGFVENSYLSQAAALCIILIFFVMAALGIIQSILNKVFKSKAVELR